VILKSDAGVSLAGPEADLPYQGVASYAISRYEVLQAFGVAALICLLFLWGLKLLKLLPAAAKQ
jgi:hypothetical protein